MRISGLPVEHDRPVYGVDAVQALELSLRAAAMYLTQSPQFRAGELERYGEAMTELTDLWLPLPLSSLQGSLAMFRMAIQRLGVRGRPGEKWRTHMLAVMEEVRGNLAKLAALT